METPNWRERFIGHLEKLRDQEDRRALAILRRGAGRQPGTVFELAPLVVPWVPEIRYLEDGAFLVAALFALHPAPGGKGTLGKAFAGIAKDSESIEQRFTALLNCNREDLPLHLRQAISLLHSKEVPVDWRRLLRDVLDWDHESRYVQREWSGGFWRSRAGEPQPESPTEESHDPEQ